MRENGLLRRLKFVFCVCGDPPFLWKKKEETCVWLVFDDDDGVHFCSHTVRIVVVSQWNFFLFLFRSLDELAWRCRSKNCLISGSFETIYRETLWISTWNSMIYTGLDSISRFLRDDRINGVGEFFGWYDKCRVWMDAVIIKQMMRQNVNGNLQTMTVIIIIIFIDML